MPLRSLRLGLVGTADVVEFRPGPNGDILFPVEYKRGCPKKHDADKVQLCAQALCLEEMLGVTVSRGALFYGRTRRRLEISFDHSMRELTEASARHLHELIASRKTPSAVRELRCDSCSLVDVCLPDAMGPRCSAAAYV